MRVLLVGAGGFLGRHVLTELLTQNHDVIAADIKPRENHSQLSWIVGDMIGLDWKREVGTVDAVICVAASLAMTDTMGDWASAVASNVIGLQRLVEWSVGSGVRHFVLTSSAGLYRRPAATLPITETHEIRPERAYWTTKLLGEQLVLSSSVRSALSPWALRLSSPYGAGQNPRTVLPLFLERARRG
ncbi:MAG: NAD(P)-dependent oxidoreductase, partial [bacterium]